LVVAVTSTPVDRRQLHEGPLQGGLSDMWLHAGQVRAGSERYGSTKKDSEENAKKA